MSFRLLDSYATINAINAVIKDAQREIVIVSPYFKMDRDATVMRRLFLALDEGRKVTMIIRENVNNVSWDVLQEAAEKGMRVFAVPLLHAKLYWSDAGAVVSSINMLTTSFEKSIEVGLRAEDDAARKEVRDFIEAEVKPQHAVDLGGWEMSPRPAPQANPPPAKHREQSKHAELEEMARALVSGGFCIRCSRSIPLNEDKPLCLDCYDRWAVYGNPDYREKCCHVCGEPARTSMADPVCADCE